MALVHFIPQGDEQYLCKLSRLYIGFQIQGSVKAAVMPRWVFNYSSNSQTEFNWGLMSHRHRIGHIVTDRREHVSF